jgi:hypothetical protein
MNAYRRVSPSVNGYAGFVQVGRAGSFLAIMEQLDG